MIPWQVRDLVDRGLAIREQMAKLKKELDDIEVKLKAEAMGGEHQELVDADREGRRVLVNGSRLVLPIVFTADKLVLSFKANSALHKTVAQAAGRHLQTFYLPSTTYESSHTDGKVFRKLAGEILGGEAGPAFVSACLARDKHGIPKSDVKVEWGSAEEIQS